MALEVFIVEVGDVMVLRCTGRITAGPECDKLQEEFDSHLDQTKKFILHLGDITFIDSSAMGLIVRMHAKLLAEGGDLKICNATEAVQKALKLTKLQRTVEMFSHELEAINDFYHEQKSVRTETTGPVVICIDSSQNVLAWLQHLLEGAGYTVKTTPSAYDARPVIKASSPALVILGPHVPGGKNQNFLDTLKEVSVLELPADFHTSDAAEAGQKLLSQVKAAAKG